MRISEIFSSKQGEGFWTGVQSTFIRSVGCHLWCEYCDTKYAFTKEGSIELCVEEIVEKAILFGNRHVVLTGGEPMLHAELVPLTHQLSRHGFAITVETSGTLELPVRCDLLSVSPKLSNSTPRPPAPQELIERHERNRSRLDILGRLLNKFNHQLKFVVDTPDDLPEIEAFLAAHKGVSQSRVFLMPQAVDEMTMDTKRKWITEYCDQKGFRYCPRMQILWYGNQRGK